MKFFGSLQNRFRKALPGDKSKPLTRPLATLSPSDGERDGGRGASGNSIAVRIKSAFVIWVWHHTPTCAEMSRLTSRSFEQPLKVMTRLKMRLHFLICVWCRRYFEQSNFLHHAAPRLGLELGDLPGRGMSAEAKQRITQRIRAGV